MQCVQVTLIGLAGAPEPLNGNGPEPGLGQGVSPTPALFACEHSRSSPHSARLKFSSRESSALRF